MHMRDHFGIADDRGKPMDKKNSKKKNLKPVFIHDNRGAAMIVVTCVMMIVSILCLTLVMAAYQMYSGVNDEGRDEMYYRQAVSFSEVLKNELTQTFEDGDRPDSGLAAYVFNFLDSEQEVVTLVGQTSVDNLCEMDIRLDKTESNGSLVITVTCVDGDEVVAVCKSKYRGSPGSLEFCEYY